MGYAYEKVLDGIDLFDCLERVSNALRREGFGIVTQLEVDDALRKKFGVNFGTYQILGACNSEMGRKMLGIEKKADGFLPSNVVVLANENDVRLAVIKPAPTMRIFSPRAIGDGVMIPTEKLLRVFESVH